jgi:hypothetical protein
MYSVISIEHNDSFINGFLVDKNNPKLINYLVAQLGEPTAQIIHPKLNSAILMVVESAQAVDENLFEELLEYGAVFAAQTVLVSCPVTQIKIWEDLGFVQLAEQDQRVLLVWG